MTETGRGSKATHGERAIFVFKFTDPVLHQKVNPQPQHNRKSGQIGRFNFTNDESQAPGQLFTHTPELFQPETKNKFQLGEFGRRLLY